MTKTSASALSKSAAAVVVLGMLLISLGVVFAAGLASTPTTSVSTGKKVDQAYLFTDPGILSLYDKKVTITVDSPPEQKFVVVIGRSNDVRAWLGEEPYNGAIGLDSATKLTVVTSKPSYLHSIADRRAEVGSLPKDPPDPSDLDMWAAQMKGEGRGKFTWQQNAEGQWSMLVMADGKHPVPTVTLTWDVPNQVSAWPALLSGVIILSVGLMMSSRARTKRRRLEHAQAVAQYQAALRAEKEGADTGEIMVDKPLPSRREIREAEKHTELSLITGERRAKPKKPVGTLRFLLSKYLRKKLLPERKKVRPVAKTSSRGKGSAQAKDATNPSQNDQSSHSPVKDKPTKTRAKNPADKPNETPQGEK